MNATCSIKTPANNVVFAFNPTALKYGSLSAGGQSNIILTCTNNTTISVTLLPNTPYQEGDDPHNNLGDYSQTPKGTLTGANPENKIAYSLYIGAINNSSSGLNGSLNASYTTTTGGQEVNFQIPFLIQSKKLATPDTYKDTVTINIEY